MQRCSVVCSPCHFNGVGKDMYVYKWTERVFDTIKELLMMSGLFPPTPTIESVGEASILHSKIVKSVFLKERFKRYRRDEASFFAFALRSLDSNMRNGL